MKKNIKNPSKKKLHIILKKHSGRDNTGQISTRHRGGRQKRYYRVIDFKRDKHDIEGVVEGVEYDPNRTADIALVKYSDGEVAYILAPDGLKVGQKIVSGENAPISLGNAMPLANIPVGTQIHNVALYPQRPAQIAKSAGSWATILAKDDKHADVKLASKEVRKIPLSAYATIGQVSRPQHKLEKIGKAGRRRLMGWRPAVRGVAQHPGSHPHGGGEGKSGTGMHPKTPWGKSAMGGKTRPSKKWSDKFIIVKRK